MKRSRLVVAILLILMASTAIAPIAEAFGGRGGRGGGGGFGGRSSGFRQPGFNHGFKGSPLGSGYNRSFPGLDTLNPGFNGFSGFNGFNRGFKGNAGFGFFAPWGSTTVYYGPGYDGGGPANYPVTYYAPQFYAPAYPAPAAYPAPPAYGPPAGGTISLTPAPPSVVSFPTGRYELRGDGVAAPYQWVWVPNALSLPPVPPAPPTAPPADPTPSAQRPPADSPPARGSQLYRWIDDQGTVHWTNRAEAVPSKYRKQATYPPPA